MSALDATRPATAEVVHVLAEQHKQLETLMEQVLAVSEHDRKAAFGRVLCLLAAHEAAEAEVVHPLIGEDLSAEHAGVVTERLAEEAAACKLVRGLEQLDVGSEEFVAGYTSLLHAVLAHAAAEERDELPAITRDLDPEQEREMVAALNQVPILATSHALELGSFAAMLAAARVEFRRPLRS